MSIQGFLSCLKRRSYPQDVARLRPRGGRQRRGNPQPRHLEQGRGGVPKAGWFSKNSEFLPIVLFKNRKHLCSFDPTFL